jgi:hypothetical protein
MFNSISFYHSHIRKATIGFGTIFSNVYILRVSADKSKTKFIQVPLFYAPREKFIQRIEQDPDFTGQVIITLPRMAFEMTSLQYDPDRKVARLGKIKSEDGTQSVFSPAPYILNFNLYVVSKNQEDCWQIIEQILPWFSPEYTIRINSLPELNLLEDIPIILKGVSFTDNYDGDLADKRIVVYNLSFDLKINLFGPTGSSSLIKDVHAYLKDLDTNLPYMTYEAKIDPFAAGPNDVHTIEEDWQDTI